MSKKHLLRGTVMTWLLPFETAAPCDRWRASLARVCSPFSDGCKGLKVSDSTVSTGVTAPVRRGVLPTGFLGTWRTSC